MTTTIKQTELDFFSTKLLADKPAIMYVRDGQMFFYVGDTKLIIDGEEQLSERVAEGVKEVTQLPSQFDKSQDVKIEGEMWLFQGESDEEEAVYILSFVYDSPKAIGIKFGHMLEGLEDKDD